MFDLQTTSPVVCLNHDAEYDLYHIYHLMGVKYNTYGTIIGLNYT